MDSVQRTLDDLPENYDILRPHPDGIGLNLNYKLTCST